jgi:Family of unknown function (DUF6496)
MRDPLHAPKAAALHCSRSIPMNERRYSTEASEEAERETYRRKRSAEGGENGNIESRKQAIATGLTKTRERGEKVLKEMRERAVKQK